MKTPKMKGPTQQELDAQAATTAATLKRNQQLDQEEAARKAELERATGAVAQNRVGMRSLLSNDWAGFTRSGDFGART